uniref:Putative glycine cleavage T protein (Aminomethyltransferase) n=1 Tax=Magnetococcus massalia (strain MO-1) TaxID=451514 RepID=A0A1S7LNM6_MAGMO|nr:putative glycine cleavage T protein (Aminomethyltransferase) [Candidatus Magnetococcus massalia]
MSLLQKHLNGVETWVQDRGFDTPGAFGDPSAERAACSGGAALVDFSHAGVIRVTGEQQKDFLSGLITNQIKRVSAAQGIYAAMLSPQGRFLWDFSILQSEVDGEPALLMLTEPNGVGDLVGRLSMYLLRTKAALQNLSSEWGVLGVVGPEAAAKLAAVFPEVDLSSVELGGVCQPEAGVLVMRDPRHSGFGWRVVAAAEALPGLWDRLAAHCIPCGFTAWEDYRIGEALPRGGSDLEQEHSLPLESGFVEMQGVDFNKGCYVGQETTARTHHRGTIKRRLYRLSWQDEGVVEPAAQVLVGEKKEAGHITSVAPQSASALALLRVSDVDSGKPLHVGELAVVAEKPNWAEWE